HRITKLLSGVVSVSILSLSACSMMPGSKAGLEKQAAVKAEPVKPQITPEQADVDELQVSPIQIVDAPPVTALPNDPQDAGDGKAESESKPVLELPKDPNTFLVRLETKNKSHPFYGDGHKKGFAINGEQGKWLVLERGKTYTFNVETDVKHDFYFSNSPVGWGGAAHTKDVKGQFTYSGDVTFSPQKDTPNVLYYQCRNHKSMGGKLLIVDAGSDVALAMAKLETERAEYANNRAVKQQESALSPAKVRQKVSYAGMLIQFKGKGLDNARKAELQKMIKDATEAEKAGKLEIAFQLAEQVVNSFKKQPKAALTQDEIDELKGEYEGILASVQSFEESHEAAMRSAKKEKRKVVDFDRKEIAKLLAEGDTLAKKNEYKQAMQKARQAERKIAEAMNEMLGSRTLVYELKFESPKEEFEYEVKRYEGYLELIPVALEVKKPRQTSIDLMQKYVDKGKFFHDKAHESMAQGKHKEALVVIKDATKEVRRGLMLLGVSM
ncbi:MAG: hypothetical protein OEX19_14790, partial [Gammaproteobacteria bacterium]|nr:hypothetical protein [Gammaproteobacteria bacterium]